MISFPDSATCRFGFALDLRCLWPATQLIMLSCMLMNPQANQANFAGPDGQTVEAISQQQSTTSGMQIYVAGVEFEFGLSGIFLT